MFKIFGIRNSDIVSDNATKRESVKITKLVEDTIKLLLDYPDPFIVHEIRPHKVQPVKETKQLSEQATKKSVSTSQWPKVIYGGMISHVGDTSRVGIFTVDKKKYICCNSDSAGAVKVHLITPDTLFISYNNTIKSIAKTITK